MKKPVKAAHCAVAETTRVSTRGSTSKHERVYAHCAKMSRDQALSTLSVSEASFATKRVQLALPVSLLNWVAVGGGGCRLSPPRLQLVVKPHESL